MAMIDSSIYFKQKSADPFGAYVEGKSEGMKMADMIRQRNQEQAIQDAYKSGITQNPDGTVSMDTNKTTMALMKANPQAAYQYQQERRAEEAAQLKLKKEKQQADLEEVTRSAWKVNDQNSYETELKNLSSKGIDISQLPKQYNQQMIDQVRRQTLSVKDRLDELDKQKKNAIELEKLAIERGKAANEKNIPQNVYAAATYAKRLEDANKQMAEITKNWDPTSVSAQAQNSKVPWLDIPLYPERLKSEERKLMDQAQRNFVNAVLRRESGSAISDTEFDSANKQYFPQPGDTPKVLEQKQRNREVAIAGLKAEGEKASYKVESGLSASPGSSPNKNVAKNKPSWAK